MLVMWSLNGSIAELSGGLLHARVDLRYPQRGLVGVRLSNDSPQAHSLPIHHMLQVHLAGYQRGNCTILDSFVRGPDLIVSYAASAIDDVQSQVYWRALSIHEHEAEGAELIVSVQTESLDSRPASSVASELLAQEVWTLAENGEFERRDQGAMAPPGNAFSSPHGVTLFRLRGLPFSYTEMIHPSDLGQSTISAGDGASGSFESRYPLFCEPLEKGVIRRSRVRGLFLPRHDDTLAALALYRQFAESEPPLTV